MENRWLLIVGVAGVVLLSSVIVVGCRLRGVARNNVVTEPVPRQVVTEPSSQQAEPEPTNQRNVALNVVDNLRISNSSSQPTQPTVATPVPTPPTASVRSSFTILLDLLEDTGLDQTLSQPGTFTLFAPTDQAFAQLSTTQLTNLRRDPAALESLLLRHVLDQTLGSTQILELTSLTALSGEVLEVSTNQSGAFVGNAELTRVDIQASNGVVHAVDAVIGIE